MMAFQHQKARMKCCNDDIDFYFFLIVTLLFFIVSTLFSSFKLLKTSPACFNCAVQSYILFTFVLRFLLLFF